MKKTDAMIGRTEQVATDAKSKAEAAVKTTEDAFSDIMKKTQGMVDKAVEDAHTRSIEAAKMVLKSFLTSWQFVAIVFLIIIIAVSIAVALSYIEP